jgi:predicted nucleic acid-binding protein
VIRFVVDASIAVKWLLPEDHTEAAQRALSRTHELLAPDLIWSEVCSALWKQWRRGRLPSDAARVLIQDFRRYPLRIAPSEALLSEAWDIAEEFGRSIYDSLYLALAVRRGCPLVTADRAFYRAIKNKPLAAPVLWVEDMP